MKGFARAAAPSTGAAAGSTLTFPSLITQLLDTLAHGDGLFGGDRVVRVVDVREVLELVDHALGADDDVHQVGDDAVEHGLLAVGELQRLVASTPTDRERGPLDHELHVRLAVELPVVDVLLEELLTLLGVGVVEDLDRLAEHAGAVR